MCVCFVFNVIQCLMTYTCGRITKVSDCVLHCTPLLLYMQHSDFCLCYFFPHGRKEAAYWRMLFIYSSSDCCYDCWVAMESLTLYIAYSIHMKCGWCGRRCVSLYIAHSILMEYDWCGLRWWTGCPVRPVYCCLWSLKASRQSTFDLQHWGTVDCEIKGLSVPRATGAAVG